MSYGDRLMAIGDAWKQYQADPLRRRVAIGDGRSIDGAQPDLLWGLDFLASPEQLAAGEPVSWVHSYPHHRPYIDYAAMRRALGWRRPLEHLGFGLTRLLGHYRYRLDYRPTPAPIRLKPDELALSEHWAQQPFVALEPYIKTGAPPSKQWPVERFAEVARQLSRAIPVYQISAPDSPVLDGLPQIRPRSFREALAYLRAARLYIGPEGGLHHGAAAMGTRAVVIYGGFTSPLITGYDFQRQLTGGAEYACGTRRGLCPHCAEHLNRISVAEVVDAARQLLEQPALQRSASA
ncbi:MAG: glycosyltransferase family 9 protein [Stagnimonas sp.]|nr:glycosyltransferase family 9 protein [Stagnimonas sp.]